MNHRDYNVIGMHCSACSARVERKVSRLPGVSGAKVNLLDNSLSVTFEDSLADEAIISAVESAGFQCSLKQPSLKESSSSKKTAFDKLWLVSAIAWGFLFLLMLLRMFLCRQMAFAFGWGELALTCVVFACNRRLLLNGVRHLFHSPDMDTLVAMGCFASFGISLVTLIFRAASATYHHFYFESAAMILVIVGFGKYLEGRAKKRAGSALEQLKNLAPNTVSCLRNGLLQECVVTDIQVGEIVCVKPGNRIPLDGIVLSGNSAIDEATLTGESIPRDVAPGDTVYAGTMNQTGAFQFRTTALAQDTLLAGIIRIVSQNAISGNRAVTLADAIARIFVPAILSLGVMTALLWFCMGASWMLALNFGISVIVVSCPCALGLATPVAVTIAMAQGARRGIIFRSGDAFEKLQKIQTVFIDKTGTLTNGKPMVTDCIPSKEISADFLIQCAASLEGASEHPLAKAVLAEAEKRKLPLLEVTQFSSIPGQGVSAFIRGENYFIGKSLPGVAVEGEHLAAMGKTLLFVYRNQHWIGSLAVRDELAPGSREAIAELKSLGIQTVMLTGDSLPCALAIGQEAGIEQVSASLLPEQKVQRIQKAQQEHIQVGMVGDGVNDAPAISQADAGIALGSGADIAIDCADVVMMKHHLPDVASSIRMARATLRVIRQNLAWAFGYNLLAIPLAAGILWKSFGIALNPILCAMAMACSSICVVCNSLRLNKLCK